MVDYLESLERLAMPDELHIKECEKLDIGVTEDFDVVEQALLELKAIKEANPSEALECLKALQSIRDKYSMPLTEYVNSFDYIKTIKHVLLKQQEQEKKNAKYKQLEEQLGCPLDVRCKVVTDSVIYDENGVEYKVVYAYMDYFDCENPFDNEMGYCDLCAFGWADYKVTWWLKEDKSE